MPYTVNNTSDIASNTAYFSVTVTGTTFDLATSFSAAPTATTNAGATVNYTVVSRNPGTVAATNVVETVQLPANLATTGFTVGGNTGTLSNGVITFTGGATYNQNSGLLSLPIGNLAANGGSVSTALAFPAPVTSPLTVTATISGAGGAETVTTNNTAVSTVDIAPRFDVTTAISGPTTVTAGNEVTYTVVTSNLSGTTTPANANSVSPAVNVVQTVSLPGNLMGAGIFASNGGTIAYNSTQDITVISFPAIGVLAAGQSQVNTISFTAPSSSFAAPIAIVTSGLTNTNAGDLNSPTVGTNNNTAQLNGAGTRPTVASTARTGTETNVYTTISSSAANVDPGNNITLTITANNAGPVAAAGVQQTVTLPTGLSFSNQGGGNYNATTGVLTFPALTSPLASAGTQTYTVTFAAPQQGFVLATATVTTTTPDAVSADNLAQTKIEVTPRVDVATTLAGPAVGLPGQTLTYTVMTASNGPAAATNVVQTVQLPAGLTNVQFNSLSAGTRYDATTGVLTISFADALPAGFNQTNTISFVAPASAASLNITAAVTTGTSETNIANNTAAVATVITPTADVAVSVTGPATATVGNPALYVVSTTNNGAAVATGVAPTLQLPAGLAVTFPAGASTGSYNSTTGVVTFATVSALASGASIANEVVVTMPDVAQLSAVAQVTSTSTDTNPANNYASVATTAAAATATTANLAAGITPATTTVNAGANVTLTATFSNQGTGTATTVVPQIALMPGLTNVTVTDAGVVRNANYNATTGVVTFQTVGSLASDASLTGTYSVSFNAPATGPVLAVASIYSATTDGALANNTALATVTVSPQADAQTSIAGPATAQPGSKVIYEIVTSNNTTAVSPATNVVQKVTVPGTPANLTFPAGSTTAVVNGNTVITFPTIASVAPGAAGAVTNYVSFTTPATATAVQVTANVESQIDINTAATSNSATITTNANTAPVAYNVVNALQTPEGNTASALLISPLVATDVDNNIQYYFVTAPADNKIGTLFVGTTAVTPGSTVRLDPNQINTLRFDPAVGFVGNAFLNYYATDIRGAVSNTAIYTIPVGQDNNSLYAYTPTKGGNTAYQNNYVLAYVTDINAARYTSNGVVYDSNTGLLATGASNGLATTGTNAVISSADKTALNAVGIDLNPTTGQFFVSNRLLLKGGSYTVSVTTTDANGGVTTQNVTIPIGGAPLPVQLVSFAAQAQGATALLTWRTAQELNNDYFVVERSFDGTSFSAVGQVKGKGTTTQATDYRLTDTGAAAAAKGRTAYYRLRQVDTDGTTVHSQVQAVRFADIAPAISLYPNPAATTTTLDLSSLPQGSYQVRIVDAAGRLVKQAQYEAGTTPTLIVEQLPAGTYLVQVSGTGFNKALRLLKE
ncbi:T9SS type A sorting domain-containing protein [Hymenobacter sp. AT01-02]|uniref:T9SS type A sorting domain-containing protein n=1 Tax=Hymenobacter sp. AT01-02 TaxID=1571877 RepID=UPI0006E32976|nr:T9SS type A sorting domain-containing protein [Hymenobacter sp. AT01-02]